MNPHHPNPNDPAPAHEPAPSTPPGPFLSLLTPEAAEAVRTRAEEWREDGHGDDYPWRKPPSWGGRL